MLFTGAQGFIGSWVAERLLEEGAEVFVLDRPAAEHSRYRLRGLHERCTPVAAALEDAQYAEPSDRRARRSRRCFTSRRRRS